MLAKNYSNTAMGNKSDTHEANICAWKNNHNSIFFSEGNISVPITIISYFNTAFFFLRDIQNNDLS